MPRAKQIQTEAELAELARLAAEAATAEFNRRMRILLKLHPKDSALTWWKRKRPELVAEGKSTKDIDASLKRHGTNLHGKDWAECIEALEFSSVSEDCTFLGAVTIIRAVISLSAQYPHNILGPGSYEYWLDKLMECYKHESNHADQLRRLGAFWYKFIAICSPWTQLKEVLTQSKVATEHARHLEAVCDWLRSTGNVTTENYSDWIQELLHSSGASCQLIEMNIRPACKQRRAPDVWERACSAAGFTPTLEEEKDLTRESNKFFPNAREEPYPPGHVFSHLN